MDWLGELLRWAVAWVPRLRLCRKGYACVKFLPQGKTKVVNPGLFVWWPLVTEVEAVPLVRQSVDLPVQTLTTMDGVSVAISATIVIHVEDPELALVQTYNWASTVQEVAAAAIIEVVTSRTWKILRTDIAVKGRREVKRQASKLLASYGVAVDDAYFTDLSKTQVVRHLGVPAPLGMHEEEV